MGFKSTQNTRNVNQSNGKYEVDDIIFYSKFVYENIKSIDDNLSLLYSSDSGIDDSETIKYSNVRNDEKYFDKILGRIEECIKRLDKFDWLINDLYKEKYAFSFLNKFIGIYNCFKEYECLEGQYKNDFEKRIIKIKSGLSCIGIDLFYD